MFDVFKKRHPPIGARPGTLVVGADALPPRIKALRYDPAGFETSDPETPDAAHALVSASGVVWIDVHGLGDEAILRKLAALFGIHPLALEDVVNVPQRPKIETYGQQLLLITRMLGLGSARLIDHDQISLVFGPGYVLSFQEKYGDILDPVRNRIRDGVGPIRHQGSDYLAYAILDTVIDGYFSVIEDLGSDLAELELRIMERTSRRDLDLLNRIRSCLAATNRTILPQREALARLQRGDTPGFTAEVQVYLRDTFDHCAQLADAVDAHRELANGLLNTYLSLVGMRTNEVMKVLTIMSSIFIPLTFLAGMYGMNFDEIPGLHERRAFPALVVVMVLLAGAMLFYFRRRGWLWERDTPEPEDERKSDPR